VMLELHGANGEVGCSVVCGGGLHFA
jgi:hypothetical protein